MKRIFSCLTAAVFAVPLLTGFFNEKKQSESFFFFPELIFSNAVEFENSKSCSDRVEVVENNEEVEIRFKIVEWFLSVF